MDDPVGNVDVSAGYQTSDLLVQDIKLRARASKVIPGGMWGHMNARALPTGYPQFFSAVKGARVWDVDGNEYIDFMCGFGPMILGYADPDVEAAFDKQTNKMDIANGPAEVMVDLAELMVDTIPAADWAMFSKNGTDATTACVMIARAGTQRRKILVAKGAYHGAAPWCTPWPGGTTPEDRAHLIHYIYNDIPSLRAAFEEAGPDLAGIIASAFRHDARFDQEMPTLEFARAARALADQAQAALILDDVRAGFRIDMGGSWEPLGVHPDLSAWSKALGNGHAIAAVTGNDRFRDAAQKVFVTGSFWCGGAAMAAAVATLHKLERIGIVAHITRLGEMLRSGVQTQADRLGIGLRQSGPAQLPIMLFEDDVDFAKGNLFTTTALRHGVYLHPWHNMFLSAAHTEADIETALKATQHGLEAVARQFPQILRRLTMESETPQDDRRQGRNISVEFLADRAKFMRMETVRLSKIAGAGHYSSTFSAAELLVALYYAQLKIKPLEPDWPDRDRFVLSKGHAAIGLYPILADLGFFDPKLLDNYTRFGSAFGDHPDMKKVKGVDFSSGSLGHGLSICVGLALASRMQNRQNRVFCMLGDGELAEGQIWEAAMSAAHFKLGSLVAIVDRNGLCIDGSTEEVMAVEPLTDRFESFGWNATRIDGHDFDQILATLDDLPPPGRGRPTVIIADTVKGRGVAMMEGALNWHVGNLEGADYDAVLAELDAGLKPATWEHPK